MRKTASRRGVAKPNPLLVLLDSTHLLKTILFFGLGSSATKKDASVLGSPRLLPLPLESTVDTNRPPRKRFLLAAPLSYQIGVGCPLPQI